MANNLNTFLDPTKNPNYPRPFIYVFDGSSLTDGSSYNQLSLPMQGDYPFTCRRLSGLPTISVSSGNVDAAGKILIYDQAYRQRFSSAIRAIYDWPFIPGITYPADGQIRFDLANVLRANNPYTGVPGSTPNYTSQLIFQGIKHVWGSSYGYQTPYQFYEKPQVYIQDFTIDYAGRLAPAYTVQTSPRFYTVPLLTRDFELLKVVIAIKRAGESVFTPSEGNVALEFFDSMGFALQSAPVIDQFVNYLAPTYANGWPTPTVIYPANGVIQFKVTSLMIDTQVPATLKVEFHGINRFPYATDTTYVQMRNVSGA